MTTIKGNKLIAEFMGWTCSKSGKTFRLHSYASPYRAKDIQYHSSWDWLMPVCHKLDYLAEHKIIEWSDDYTYLCDKLDEAVTTTYTITPVWKIVIEFIKWYNAQTK